MFNLLSNINVFAKQGGVAAMRTFSVVAGLAAGCATGCEEETPPQRLEAGLATHVSSLPLEPHCTRPAIAPHQKNIKSVWLKPSEVMVRYRGEPSFYDLNPKDGLDLPEFFTGKTFDPTTTSVLIEGLSVALEDQAKQRAAKLYPIRNTAANSCETQQAAEYFQVGVDYAREELAVFQRAFMAREALEIHITQVHAMRITYAGGRHATFYSYNKYGEDNAVIPHIHQLAIKADGRRVVINDRTLLKPFLPAAEALFADLATTLLKNQRQLRAAQEATQRKTSPGGRKKSMLEYLPYR